METDDFDSWNWIMAAQKAGWIDPGFTETLPETVKRAKDYLRDRPHQIEKYHMDEKACEGGSTDSVRTTEHMEKCRVCGQMVRDDLTEHSFFGFKASCPQRESKDGGEKPCQHFSEGDSKRC